MTDKPIFILIPTSRKIEEIRYTIDSINQCEAPINNVNIIIIENSSKNGIEEFLQQMPNKNFNFQYFYVQKRGKSNALNECITSMISMNSLLIMTDDDIIFNKKWIVNFYYASLSNPKNTFFGSSFAVRYEEEPQLGIRNFLPKSAIGLSDEYYEKEPHTIFLGFNWAAYSDDLINVGLFDKNFGPGGLKDATGQETEMQNRLIASNIKKVFVKNNSVIHFVPSFAIKKDWILSRISKDAKSHSLRFKKYYKMVIFLTIFLIPYLLNKFFKLHKKSTFLLPRYYVYHYYLYKHLVNRYWPSKNKDT